MRVLLLLLALTVQLAPVLCLFEESIQAYYKAQRRVLSRYTYNPELLCTSAAVHGFMRKQAGPRDVPRASSRMDMYHMAKLPIYQAGMTAWISRKYRFIYVRQPKSASSTVMQTLYKLLCNGTAECEPDVLEKAEYRSISDETWSTYFVFTFVRNPWRRMASAYFFLNRHFLFIRPEDLSDPTTQCELPFDVFAENPHNMHSACLRRQCCVYLKVFKTWPADFVRLHIGDQAQVVFTPSGKSAVDYIGRAEHYDEDWADVVNTINAREGTAFPSAGLEAYNVQRFAELVDANVTCMNDAYAAAFNESIMLSATKHYAMDIYAFGFLRALDSAQFN